MGKTKELLEKIILEELKKIEKRGKITLRKDLKYPYSKSIAKFIK